MNPAVESVDLDGLDTAHLCKRLLDANSSLFLSNNGLLSVTAAPGTDISK